MHLPRILPRSPILVASALTLVLAFAAVAIAAVPTVSITSGPEGTTGDDSPLFGFSVAGATNVACSIDQGTPSYAPCSHATSHSVAQPLADGAYTFRVRADDGAGATATATRSFTVVTTAYPLPPADAPRTPPTTSPPRLMSPFPLVRLAGRLTRGGVKVRLFTVSGPRAALVRVKVRPHCASGRRCRVRRGTRTVGRKGVVRLKAFELRYRAGSVIEIRVSRAGLIGKYTRFVVRRGKPPRRVDQCLSPGAKRGSRCPAG
jgi:hypothetical protein